MNRVYAELLQGLDIHVPEECLEKEKVKLEPPIHGCNAPVYVRNGYAVCDACGLVLANEMIDIQPSQYKHSKQYRHEGEKWLGADEDSYVARRRFYKPITHFRQHLRSYLYARDIKIPVSVLQELRQVIDVNDRNAYTQVKKELKRLKQPKLYKDIFDIIYMLGGRKPQITPEQVDLMCNYFARWWYQYNVLERFGAHNTPSMFMLLDIILKEFGHEPYYFIPKLKNGKLRDRVYEIYEKVKCCCPN